MDKRNTDLTVDRMISERKEQMKKKKHGYRWQRRASANGFTCKTDLETIKDNLTTVAYKQDELMLLMRSSAGLDKAKSARIEIEKRLFSSVHGNKRFAQELCAKPDAGDDQRSILRRMTYLEDVATRLLGCDGVSPIAPERNQQFDASAHRAVSTTVPNAEDSPNAVAECLEVGYAVAGIVTTPADVVVFENNN